MRKSLFLIACFIALSAYPQKQKPALIDSLILELPHLKNDTATARMYKVIAEKYSSTDPAKAKLYVAKGLSLTTKIIDTTNMRIVSDTLLLLYVILPLNIYRDNYNVGLANDIDEEMTLFNYLFIDGITMPGIKNVISRTGDINPGDTLI